MELISSPFKASAVVPATPATKVWNSSSNCARRKWKFVARIAATTRPATEAIASVTLLRSESRGAREEIMMIEAARRKPAALRDTTADGRRAILAARNERKAATLFVHREIMIPWADSA